MPASVFKMIITALFIITIFHSAVNGKEAFDFQKECRIHFYPVEGRTFSETVNSLKVILPSRYGKGTDWQTGQVSGTKRCKAFSVLNMCISVAYDSDGKYGIGTGETLKEARKNAKADCLLKSSGCIYSESSCSIENSLGE